MTTELTLTNTNATISIPTATVCNGVSFCLRAVFLLIHTSVLLVQLQYTPCKNYFGINPQWYTGIVIVYMLNKEQDEVVRKDNCSLLIVAGAGTGKTRVLVEKIIHLLQSGVAGHRILALTFTNKAADEMRSRVHAQCPSAHMPFVGTFHSFCVSLLREFCAEINLPRQFIIFDRDASKRVLKRCMKQEGITAFTPRVMQHTVAHLKTGLAAGTSDDLIAAAERLLPLYNLALEREQALDFDDLLLKAIAVLQKRQSVREQVQSRYAYILVDEFQDTDGIQGQLISLLKGAQTFIVAVGDTDQTIYSWRGASIHNMLSFAEQHDPVATVFLTQNYRSSGIILAAANAVIAKNIYRQDKDLVPTRGTGDQIVFLASDDGEVEASRIAHTIADLQTQGTAYRDIAILFRANFQARAFETQMLAQRIPYTVLGTRFFERSEVKDLLAYLTLVQNPNSREAFIRAAGVPRRGIGARTLDRIFSGEEHLLTAGAASRVAQLRSVIAHITALAEKQSASALVKELITLLDFKNYLAATYDTSDERLREVGELISFADRFSHLSGTDGIARMLAEVALSSEQDSLRAHTRDTVRLMTIHAAKGLEFSCVFIAGMEEGLFPFLHDADGTHDEEEERRLCYVAMTRAKDKLYCSYAQRRNMFGSYRSMRPSSFLRDIPEHLIIAADTVPDIPADDGSILW